MSKFMGGRQDMRLAGHALKEEDLRHDGISLPSPSLKVSVNRECFHHQLHQLAPLVTIFAWRFWASRL